MKRNITKLILIPYKEIKNFFYKTKFNRICKGLKIKGWPIIQNDGKIIAGRNLYLKSNSQKIEILAEKNSEIHFGDNVFINDGTIIYSLKKISIGNNVLIGNRVLIYDSDWHGISGNIIKTEPVEIGNNVWIGAGTIILKGVLIGENSIIGAGSVVNKNIPKNSIYAGNPAKFIRKTSGYSN